MLIQLSNAITTATTTATNWLKGALVCTLKGHDVCMTQCLRCFKWDKTWMEQ